MAFKLNLSKFKKVSADKDHTVMRDTRGNEIKVAHKMLTPALREQLSQLPVHLAEGGKVEDPKQPIVVNVNNGAQPAAPSATDAMGQAYAGSMAPPTVVEPPADPMGAAYAGAYNKDAAAQASQQSALASGQPTSAPAPVIAPQATAPIAPAPQAQAPTAMAATPTPVKEAPDAAQLGFAKEQAGIRGEAQAIGREGNAEAAVQAQSLRVQQAAQTDFQDRVARKQKEIDALNDDVRKGHIDPHKYMGSLTTGQKIFTAIGLLMGGIGGGILKQENPAMKFINQEIDRDIEAQKEQLGSKKTLLSANMAQLQDMRAAAELTKAMQLSMVSTQLQMEAAKSKDPLAKARALQESGKLDIDVGSKIQNAAKLGSLNALLAKASSDPGSLPTLVDAIEKFDPKKAEDLRKRMVPNMGFASSEKGAESLMELKGTVDAAKDGLNELSKMANMTGKSLSPEQVGKAEVIAGTLRGLLRVPITGPGAMNESEIKLLEGMIANPTKMFTLDSSTKVRLKTLTERLDKSVELQGKARGIEPRSPESKLNATEKTYLKWARANPSSPQAKDFFQKYGITQ